MSRLLSLSLLGLCLVATTLGSAVHELGDDNFDGELENMGTHW